MTASLCIYIFCSSRTLPLSTCCLTNRPKVPSVCLNTWQTAHFPLLRGFVAQTGHSNVTVQPLLPSMSPGPGKRKQQVASITTTSFFSLPVSVALLNTQSCPIFTCSIQLVCCVSQTVSTEAFPEVTGAVSWCEALKTWAKVSCTAETCHENPGWVKHVS